MAEDDFPTPAIPNNLKQMVALIKGNRAYATFIHEKVRDARNGDQAAKAVVMAHFEPETKELTDLQLSEEQAVALKRCTDPRTHLVDFAYYVAYPPS